MPSISASPACSRAMASAECDGGLVTGGSTEVQATFAGAFIRNIGADMRNFWVFTGKDSVQEILQIMAANKARILSLTPYVSSPGEPRKYAAVLVANSEGVKTTVWPDLTWEE